MVKKGEAYWTRFGSVHPTEKAALEAEKIEEEDAYRDYILARVKNPCATGLSGAINWTFREPDIFLSALQEFGFLTEYITKREHKREK